MKVFAALCVLLLSGKSSVCNGSSVEAAGYGVAQKGVTMVTLDHLETPLLDAIHIHNFESDVENKTYYLDVVWQELQSQCHGNFRPSSVIDNQQVENLFLMQSLNQPFVITTAYLLLVLKIGPYLMAKTRRFDLIPLITAYNVLQIIFNTSLFATGMRVIPQFSIWWNPSDQEESETVLNIVKLNHLFLMLKIFDLVETIFFVLRKKMEQVSFLHVFHHVGLVWITWISCRYFRGIYGFLPAAFNTFVHTFMYVYYLQSSRGKVMNKLWKKCLTSLQIGHQLLIFALYLVLLTNTKSPYETLYLSVTLGYMVIIIYLFFKFYKDSYTSKKSLPE